MLVFLLMLTEGYRASQAHTVPYWFSKWALNWCINIKSKPNPTLGNKAWSLSSHQDSPVQGYVKCDGFAPITVQNCSVPVGDPAMLASGLVVLIIYSMFAITMWSFWSMGKGGEGRHDVKSSSFGILRGGFQALTHPLPYTSHWTSLHLNFLVWKSKMVLATAADSCKV